MLCGAWGCVRASVLAFLKQGSSLQQHLIAVVVETAEVYAKMAHNVLRLCVCLPLAQSFKFTTNVNGANSTKPLLYAGTVD